MQKRVEFDIDDLWHVSADEDKYGTFNFQIYRSGAVQFTSTFTPVGELMRVEQLEVHARESIKEFVAAQRSLRTIADVLGTLGDVNCIYAEDRKLFDLRPSSWGFAANGPTTEQGVIFATCNGPVIVVFYFDEHSPEGTRHPVFLVPRKMYESGTTSDTCRLRLELVSSGVKRGE